MITRYFRSPANIGFAGAALVIAGVHVSLIVAGLAVAPIGFDEAYVVQAPWNLVIGNGYSTFDWEEGGDNRVFDSLVSTGPTVLLPVALSFLLFGVGIVQVRLAMIPFTVLLIVVAFLFGRRIGGRWVGLAGVLALTALNLRIDLPESATWSTVDGLGELPATALLLLAVLLLPRSRVLAGLALGFAALCKLVVLLAAPALAIAVLLLPVPSGKKAWPFRIAAALTLAAFTALPSALWELVKLTSLGWTEYLENLKSYGSFVLNSGSGLAQTSTPNIVGRSIHLAQAWFVPWQVWVAAAAAGIALSAFWLIRRLSSRPLDVGARSQLVFFVAGVGAIGALALWWVGISNSIFVRHVFPGMLLIPVVLTAFAGAAIAALLRSQRTVTRIGALAAAVGIVTLVGWQSAHSVVQAFDPGPWSRSDQVAAAEFITAREGPVQHVGYWSNPELRLLGATDSVPYPLGSGPLVLSPQMGLLVPGLYERARDACTNLLYESKGFVVCDVDADSPVELDWMKP